MPRSGRVLRRGRTVGHFAACITAIRGRHDRASRRRDEVFGTHRTLMRYARSGRMGEDRLSGQPEGGTRATHVELTGNQSQAW